MNSPRQTVFASAIVATCFTAWPVDMARAASTPGRSEAVVVGRLSLVKDEDLDWGTLVPSPLAGTVTINATSGARTTTGGVTTAGGSPQRAVFVGAGRVGLLTLVTLGASPTLINGSGGTMATLLQLDGPGLRILTGTGIQTIGVGGILAVGANQAEGDYAGTFSLTVTYF